MLLSWIKSYLWWNLFSCKALRAGRLIDLTFGAISNALRVGMMGIGIGFALGRVMLAFR